MVPRADIRDAILGVLGRALFLHPGIELHAFIFLSNHYHLLLTASDPETLARFCCFLNGNIARKVNKLLGRRGRFWARRYSDIPVVDDAAQLDRLRYIFQNGCKEGLVASPMDWPGATSTPALARGVKLRGCWEDTTGLFRARRSGEKPDPGQFRHTYEIPFHPLPCWKGISRAEQQARCQEIVDEIEASMVGVRVRGIERIVAQNPNEAPEFSSRSPEPRCHASTKEAWIMHVASLREVRDLYRRISIRIRRGELSPTSVPAYTLPPPLHWNPDRNLRTVESRAPNMLEGRSPHS